MHLQYIPLKTFGALNLSLLLAIDTADTHYNKADLCHKIAGLVGPQNDTDAKIRGFVIREAASGEIWGFVLFKKLPECTKITDMFMFKEGEPYGLFSKISYFMQREENWEGKFELTSQNENSESMRKLFELQSKVPTAHAYTNFGKAVKV